MRLAVLADIHAILPALEAALSDIQSQAVDGVIVAGDMLAGPNPREVMRLLRQLGCWMIRGNQENYMLRFFRNEAPEWWYTSLQWSFMRWNFQQLDIETLEYLAALPEQRVISLPGTDSIRVVHGSPREVSELVFPERDLALLDRSLALVPEKVVIFGHTHRSWALNRGGRLAFNPGALSGNFTGAPRGGYAMLEWTADGWQVQLRELNYDVERIRQSFELSGLMRAGGAVSTYWMRSIETGLNILPDFISFAYQQASLAGHGDLEFVPNTVWEQADELFAAGFNERYPSSTSAIPG